MNKPNSLYEQQKNGQWKSLTNPLKNDSEIKSSLNAFITTFYWKFRDKKGMPSGTYAPEIDFKGFKGFKDFPDRAGHCKLKIKIITEWQNLNGEKIEGSETKTEYPKLSISLHQYYLLDKLGMDKIFINENTYFLCGFNELMGTIAHELAHAYQNTLHLKDDVKSQCESTGDRDANGKLLYPELAAEHTALTREIKSLIESSSEYQVFKQWWTSPKQTANQTKENPNSNFKKGLENKTTDSLLQSPTDLKKTDELLKSSNNTLKDTQQGRKNSAEPSDSFSWWIIISYRWNYTLKIIK